MAWTLDHATSSIRTAGGEQAQDLITRGYALLGAVIVLAVNTGTTGPTDPTLDTTPIASAAGS